MKVSIPLVAVSALMWLAGCSCARGPLSSSESWAMYHVPETVSPFAVEDAVLLRVNEGQGIVQLEPGRSVAFGSKELHSWLQQVAIAGEQFQGASDSSIFLGVDAGLDWSSLAEFVESARAVGLWRFKVLVRATGERGIGLLGAYAPIGKQDEGLTDVTTVFLDSDQGDLSFRFGGKDGNVIESHSLPAMLEKGRLLLVPSMRVTWQDIVTALGLLGSPESFLWSAQGLVVGEGD